MATRICVAKLRPHRAREILRLRTYSAGIHPQTEINYGPEAAGHEELTPQPNPVAEHHPPGEPHFPVSESGEHAKTIGDALEEAAEKGHDKKLELKDARAIQSAEARATGASTGVLGGPASYASNLMRGPQEATLGDALKDAKHWLPKDKVVTERDADRVMQAEARNDPLGEIDPHGVAAAVKEAADYNVEHGFVHDEGAARGRAGLGRGRGAGGAS